jgi:hypothetical protein
MDLQSDFLKGNSLAQPSVKSCQLEKGKTADAKSLGKQLNSKKSWFDSDTLLNKVNRLFDVFVRNPDVRVVL